MKIEKKVLNEALRMLGKVVCQTSPVELYRSVRFVGNADGITAMATDGIETVSVQIEAVTEKEVDFCVPFRALKDLIRINRSETLELDGTYIEFPDIEKPELDAVVTELPENFTELLSLAVPIVKRNEYRRVLQGERLWDLTLGLPEKENGYGLIDDCTTSRSGEKQVNGVMLRYDDPWRPDQKDDCFRRASYLARTNTKGSSPKGQRELFSSRIPQK